MLASAFHTTINGWDLVVALLICLAVVLVAAVLGRRVTPATGPAGYWWSPWLLVVILFTILLFGLALTVRW